MSVALALKWMMLQSVPCVPRSQVSIPGQVPAALPLSCLSLDTRTGRVFWHGPQSEFHPFRLAAAFLSQLLAASFIGERAAGTVLRISLYLLAKDYVPYKPQ